MTLTKTILIGGIATTLVVVSVGVYLTKDNSTDQNNSEKSLLADYRDFLEEINDSKTKNDLLASCKNPQKFAEQIQALEDKLSALEKRKIDNLMQEDSEHQPKQPGVCALDYDGNPMRPGSWEVDFDGNQIPPASWPPDFDTGKPIPPPGWPLDYNGNPIPPGECPLDYDGSPMRPGSWEVDFDGNQIPPASWPPDFDTGKPIPPPGWPLDYNGNPIPPGSTETPSEYMPEIPVPGSQPLDFVENVNITPLQEIIELAIKIRLTLDELKSLCDEEKTTEIISTSCPDACKKYSDCASYTEDVTKEDIQDAYDSCMEECAKWSDKTKICINKKPIKKPLDCRDLSFCALPEYDQVLKQ